MAPKFLNIPEQEAIWVTADALQRQVVAILQAVKVPDRHAQITAEILTAASLRGVDTHGVGNSDQYSNKKRPLARFSGLFSDSMELFRERWLIKRYDTALRFLSTINSRVSALTLHLLQATHLVVY